MCILSVSLTKTDKKGLALKQKIVDDVRGCVEKFKSVYVFTVKNMRNVNMKEVREQWKPSRFFFGKNKVIAIGLGRNSEEEVQDDLHQVCSADVILFCLTRKCFAVSCVFERSMWTPVHGLYEKGGDRVV